MVYHRVRNDLNACSMANIDHVLKLVSVPPLGDDIVGYWLPKGRSFNGEFSDICIACPPDNR